ncbi:MAG: hypothetical protein IT328_23945 [Caldilineaceae bacterium]|nr:hypothetical protein [Caldilineaceae bacterium]
MNSVAPAVPAVNNARKAADTRSRRRAAGKYPTKAQKDAFAKYMRPRRLYGEPVWSVEELRALATHPHLHPRQRAAWAAKADALAAELEAADYADDIEDRAFWAAGSW